ncbi:hypothetical protein DESUT3_22450 [Desulfuromonas versatilis]|uniref:YicC family protein n=1 Tax=Desulfuromonas versatilis TaxID=2802975 RepID=A0ABM8HT78_9BACT|nr:YicC/YloC family endoribonuclease [Desulfuromonas versatilis]BCR05176.1 hypothetical protein DESUT3_22450 [Desulfuromonas versatilis]
MIKSMTGYGKGEGASAELSVSVEIKSVNHRYCDITVKAPRSLMALENETKKRVGERLRRGKIDVFVNLEFTGLAAAKPVMNRPLVAAYVELFEEMRNSFPVDGGIPLSLLVQQRDVISLEEGALSESLLRQALEAAIGKAVDALEAMRVAEGSATCADIEERLRLIEEMLGKIEARAPRVAEEWRGKLSERLEKLGGDVAFDPQRVAQEVAIFADRCDISEEITRFKSHLEQFRGLLQAEEPVGRQMDFLTQEFNREVNTMGSKSNDSELTRTVVGIKAELEKIREQVQNIE